MTTSTDRPDASPQTRARRWYTEPERLTLSLRHDRRITPWYSQFTCDALVHLRGGIETGRILDVGCGEGMLLEMLGNAFPGAHIQGIEPNATCAAIARDRAPDCVVVEAPAEKLEPEPADVDLVVMQLNLGLFDDAQAAIRRAVRRLGADGLLYITDTSRTGVHAATNPHESHSLDEFLADQTAASLTAGELAQVIATATHDLPVTVHVGDGLLGLPEADPRLHDFLVRHPRHARWATRRDSGPALLFAQIWRSPR